MKKVLENVMLSWVWLSAVLVVGLAAVMLALFAYVLVDASAAGEFTMAAFAQALPGIFSLQGFTVATALCALLLAAPLALALSLYLALLAPRPVGGLVSGMSFAYSALPAVLMGFMAMRYIAPQFSNPFWALTACLAFMALPRLTVEYIKLFSGDRPIVISTACLGGHTYQAVFRFLLPKHSAMLWRVTLRGLARAMGEGVAVMMILSVFSDGTDTLSTAIMRAMGLGSGNISIEYALVLALALLIPLSVLYVLMMTMKETEHG